MRERSSSWSRSLLYEGYALYPYTPGATKNATPTPFGIVYPPAYAEELPTTFDHLRLECVLAAEPEAELRATVRFLQASGERHQALERRLELGPAALDELAATGSGETFEFEGARDAARPGPDALRARSTSRGSGGSAPASTTRPRSKPGLERAEALVASLLSTHVVVETVLRPLRLAARARGPGRRGGRRPSRSVNTFPVLASPADDAILAATIVLPDHPRIAPESLGNLFDNTEIEEALLLHVQALSDDEREAIADQDPAVREMVERAERTTPEQMLALHGRLEDTGAPTVPQWTEPGAPADPGPPRSRGTRTRASPSSSSTASPSARGRR